MDEKQLVDGATALAEKQSRVIKIEPAEQPQNMLLRVAAYTRVSSDSEDQLNSFAAQNRYYTELISGKAEWRMVDIYEEYETNRLRRLFSAFECVAELNADLLKSTVSEVLVTRQNVKLRLKNGQIIERSDLQ